MAAVTLTFEVDAATGIAKIKQFGQASGKVTSNVATGWHKVKRAALAALGTYGALRTARFAESAVKEFAAFSKSMAEVSTLSGPAKAHLGEFKTEILQMSKETGQPLEALTKGLYDSISAGIPAGDAMKFLGVAAKLAVAGVSSTAETVDLLTSAMNAYQVPASDAERISDKFMTTVQLGKTTITELAANIGKVAPAASAMGLSMDEVLGGFVAMTKQGISTAESATGLRAAITAFSKPTKAMTGAFEQMGWKINAAELTQRGMTETLRRLKTVSKTTGKSMAELLPQEAFKSIAAMTVDIDALSAGNLRVATNAGVTKEAYGVMSKEMSMRIAKLSTAFHAMKVEIGKELAPQFAGLIDFVKASLPHFKTLAVDILKILIPAFKGAVNVAGWLMEKFVQIEPVVVKFVRTLVDKGARAIREFWPVVRDLATGLLEKLKPALSAAVEGGRWLAEKFSALAEAGEGKLKPALLAGAEFLGKVTDAVMKTLPEFQKLANHFYERLKPAFDEIKKAAGWLWDNFKLGYPILMDNLIPAFQAVVTTIGKVVDKILDVAEGVAKFAGKLLADPIRAMKELWNFWKPLLTRFVDSGLKMGSALVDNIIDGIKSKAGDSYAAVKDWLQGVRDYLPFSPAKTGPLSDLDKSGAAIPKTLAEGLTLGAPRFLSAVEMMFGKSDKIQKQHLTGKLTAEKSATDLIIEQVKAEQAARREISETTHSQTIYDLQRTADDEKDIFKNREKARRAFHLAVERGEVTHRRALSVGFLETVKDFDSSQQLMLKAGADTATGLRDGFKNGFVNLIKGDVSSIPAAFDAMGQSILNIWVNMIAEMLAQWALSGLMNLPIGLNGSTVSSVINSVTGTGVNAAVSTATNATSGASAAVGAGAVGSSLVPSSVTGAVGAETTVFGGGAGATVGTGAETTVFGGGAGAAGTGAIEAGITAALPVALPVVAAAIGIYGINELLKSHKKATPQEVYDATAKQLRDNEKNPIFFAIAAANAGSIDKNKTPESIYNQALSDHRNAAADLGILPKYAYGGVVDRPTHALVGEAGPEAIVPLPDGRSVPVQFTGQSAQPASPREPIHIHLTSPFSGNELADILLEWSLDGTLKIDTSAVVDQLGSI